MAKKKDLDEPIDGPFKIDDAMFGEGGAPDGDQPGFTDDEVRAIMGEEQQSWVSEGEPEPPEAHEASAPPPPPAPPGNQSWVSEGTPELAPRVDDELAPPPEEDDPDATREGPTPAARPPAQRAVQYEDSAPPPRSAEASGLVTDYDPNAVEEEDEEEDGADLGSSAMTYMAIGIGASLVGVIGALVVVLLLTAGGGEPPPEEGVLPEQEVGNIQVRRTLKAPPKPTRMEENIKEFEEREAARGRGELVEEDEAVAEDTDAPADEADAPAEPEIPAEPVGDDGGEDDAPLGSKLD